MSTFDGFRKRNRRIVPFDPSRISRAIHAAATDLIPTDLPEGFPDDITSAVCTELLSCVQPDGRDRLIPDMDTVHRCTEQVLKNSGWEAVAVAYHRYRETRDEARKRLRIRRGRKKTDVTDMSLLLVDHAGGELTEWSREELVEEMTTVHGLPQDTAESIAKSIENRLIKGNMLTLTDGLLKEFLSVEFEERRLGIDVRRGYAIGGDFLEQLIFQKSNENSNMASNNPEAVNLGLSEYLLKQWALDNVFSPQVRRAHETGAIHVHDLGFPTRLYCSAHSIEYIKKFGLRGLCNLPTTSSPARSASVLTGHLNTFLASMQAYYAGALGLAYVNILYSPYLRGMSDKVLYQIAQELIFNGSQNAFSRGNQALFLDFNIHTGVPKHLKDVPAIGPGGLPVEEDGKVLTYGDLEPVAQRFCSALLRVWASGDSEGRAFAFPKCDFHISDETFSDPAQHALFLEACQLSSKNGSTYFIFDRDAVTLSACCRLRTTVEDPELLKHPEHLRYCGFQNITINVPQAAYRASRRGDMTLGGVLFEIDKAMALAVDAHLQKKAWASRMMAEPGGPLHQLGKPSCDGKPYVDLEKATYIVGLIGINDAVNFLTGSELHETAAAEDTGLRIVAHMYLRLKEYGAKHGLKFSLEESPAESASRRLARADLRFFRDEALSVYKGGDEDFAYYTNSIHLSASAPVGLVDRIRKQSMYHPMIEAGAIVHAFVGEERPVPEAIGMLVRDTFERTQCAQLTISPESTFCLDCRHKSDGIKAWCPACGSDHVEHETRVVGYFSKIQDWNKSKRYGELRDRHQGQYTLQNAVVTCTDKEAA